VLKMGGRGNLLLGEGWRTWGGTEGKGGKKEEISLQKLVTNTLEKRKKGEKKFSKNDE